MKWTYRLAAMFAAGLLSCVPLAAPAQKISDLPAASALGGTEQLAGAQGSGCATHVAPCASVRVSAAQIATYANASLDADLVALAGLSTAANKCTYWTSTAAASLYDCTSFMRGLAGSADAAAARGTLGLGTLATQSGTFSGTSSGTNTGDQTSVSGNAGTATKWATARNLSLTGDVTGTLASVDGSAAVSGVTTLATVNSNVGTFGSGYAIPVVTANGKGLVTALSTTGSYPIVHPGYVAGRYYWPLGTQGPANGTIAIGAATLRLAPIILPQAVTISELFARITTASAGGNIQLGIYAADASTKLSSGAPLATTASISTATATVVSAATAGGNVALPAGPYWLGVMADNGTVVVQGSSGPTMRTTALIGSTTLANVSSGTNTQNLGYVASVTFGTWPNLTSSPPSEAVAVEPLVGFKVASVP